MSDTDVSVFLMQLELEQLDKITADLQLRAEQRAKEQAEQKSKPRFPPSFNDLDSMAENVGLDLSSLIKDIKRRS
ncbi:hypothetical protein [Marinobacterium stanieri]|uniref:Uncharacterized protein n=1 Tax=Marinobacterium stanieri TaxID=49186 RepID=A0A1N6R8I1_9GAMM|nr:hypothetical protein [Marinobacterium stanieri]SIQ25148.1 hypothetical protein SAMN05421647_103173 [Marinobacterium stanieri]